MASVGISIPPQEHVTSPVAASKAAFDGDGRRFEAFARRSSGHGGQSERAPAGQRLMRKRSWSVHGDWRGLKRRRKGIVPPTKFLLGGNICDPLNLGSLNDEEANRIANANTPVSSPMPTPRYRKEPIEVIIPPDISDPLGLNGPEALSSPTAQRRRKAKRRKKPSGHGSSEPTGRSLSESSATRSASEGDNITTVPAPASAPVVCTEFEFAACVTTAGDGDVTAAGAEGRTGDDDVADRPCTLSISVDPPAPSTPAPVAPTPSPRPSRPQRRPSPEIVSPVVPQPGGRAATFPRPGPANPEVPVFKPRDEAFQYGNYNRYYGYRNPDPHQLDSRLGWLRREWFSGLDVLDVGCNVGHVTLTVARDYQPRRCVGVDIDASLIKAARRNVKHYQREGGFPQSMRQLYGDLQPSHKAPGTQFPRNVTFQHANFVLESDALLDTVKPEFDTVLCLSITKWIHLNFGDAGLRRFFRRAFLSLKPGGRLLLEPQPWASYGKKKKLTRRIWENFHQIRLRPEHFPDLLINEVGFERYQTVGRPHHSSRGFSRQLQLFTKAKDATVAPVPGSTSQGASPAATVAMDTTAASPGERTQTSFTMDTTAASPGERTQTSVTMDTTAASPGERTLTSVTMDTTAASPCERTSTAVAMDTAVPPAAENRGPAQSSVDTAVPVAGSVDDGSELPSPVSDSVRTEGVRTSPV